MRTLLTIVLVVIGGVTFAAEPARLSVRPRLCIVDEYKSSCEIDLAVRWSTAQQGDYCLLENEVEAPLACWQDEDSGGYSAERIIRAPLLFGLGRAEGGPPLATAGVEVMSARTDRRNKRRRRHVWSIL